MDNKAVHFLASFTGGIILWAFQVFDDYIVALFLLGVWLVLGIVPLEIALSGFSTSSWFFMVGVLGLAAAVTKTQLLYRMALKVLKRIPPNYTIYTFIFGVSGFFMTPLMPDDRAKVAIISPISKAISEIMGFKPCSAGSAGLALSAYIGFTQMSFMFLTGATKCLIGWNLLSEAARLEFGWTKWALAAFPAGVCTMLFLFVAIHFLFPHREEIQTNVSSKILESQLAHLGPITKAEWVTLLVLAVSLIGWLTAPIHKISETWVALTAFFVLLLTGVLGKDDVKRNIDWRVLLFIGVILSLDVIMSHLKVDGWLLIVMGPILSVFSPYPLAFLSTVTVLIYLVRFFLNKTSAVILLTLNLTPWGQDFGIHPGVVLLTILMAVESWFLPYQTVSYQIAYYSANGQAFSHSQARKLMVARFFASLLALIISVPYWRLLGLIR